MNPSDPMTLLLGTKESLTKLVLLCLGSSLPNHPDHWPSLRTCHLPSELTQSSAQMAVLPDLLMFPLFSVPG